jgi:hypothetical protein
MKHGTITGYTTHKCHCELCTGAWRDYARQWARDNRAGRQRLTGAAETRRHLLRLIARGHTAHSIESMTGLSDQAILHILSRKTTRVRHDTADSILSVALDDLPGPRSLTPAKPARLLLQQMRRSGIPAKDVVAMLGYRPSSSIPTARNPRILARNHRRVCVLYELLARQGRVPASLLEEVGA